MDEDCNCYASCGENRYHKLGSRGCRFENTPIDTTQYNSRQSKMGLALDPPKPPPNYKNGRLVIPDMGADPKPNQWQMVVNVADAIKINQDLDALKVENEHMKRVLREIFETSSEADIVRTALRGLN